MKQLIITAMLVIVTGFAFGQKSVNKKEVKVDSTWKHVTSSTNKYLLVETTLYKPKYLIVTGVQPTPTMEISVADSTGTYTVKFKKSAVKFINDSTFTFKIPKQ
ncbi:hypothetical protein [Mucilaginibacter sp. L3T2-6]|uniref:hypothetical protein n=1 Tax=Mucilaginibacter sp. L3T2-6 TaxID=3062491 RepID=UPI00267523EC|nr:hypothetical protein [Mucilaginibacter sp. L3T2-6]MDO3641983.1 hypothetical protein [Mucilaginibacter sp. L3T2-6]MDV6214339.1 hypothetical protein [Mucilaginibacter sp. L3T2-6]